MLDERFSYESFVHSADPAALARALSDELTRRLRATATRAQEGYALVDELRRLGHDLWSFDESDDFQAWCGDWTRPPRPFELIVQLNYAEDEAPSAACLFKASDCESG
jgi:hypothetical protein